VTSFSGYASAELVRSDPPNTGAADAISRRAPHIRVRDARAQHGCGLNTPERPNRQVNKVRFAGLLRLKPQEVRQFRRELPVTAHSSL